MARILKLVQGDSMVTLSLDLEQMPQAVGDDGSSINMSSRLGRTRQGLGKEGYCSFQSHKEDHPAYE